MPTNAEVENLNQDEIVEVGADGDGGAQEQDPPMTEHGEPARERRDDAGAEQSVCYRERHPLITLKDCQSLSPETQRLANKVLFCALMCVKIEGPHPGLCKTLM